MGQRLLAPRSLDEMAQVADVLAVVEITARQEEAASQSTDVTVTLQLATAEVVTPIAGTAVGEELEIYVSRTSIIPDVEQPEVLGRRHDTLLVPGTRLVAALVEDQPRRFELTGGELLISESGEVSVLGRDECLSPEEKSLATDVEGRSLPNIVSALADAASRPRSTQPEATMTGSTRP